MKHELKTYPEPLEATRTGAKRFEIRSEADGRRFAVGDELELREWNPHSQGDYTGRTLRVLVTYVSRDAWGLPPGLVVLGVSSPIIDDAEHQKKQLVEDRKLVSRIDQFAKGLNEREVEFVADMVRRVEKGSIMTGPQRTWAERIDRERIR